MRMRPCDEFTCYKSLVYPTVIAQKQMIGDSSVGACDTAIVTEFCLCVAYVSVIESWKMGNVPIYEHKKRSLGL